MDKESIAYKPKIHLVKFLTDTERILNKPCAPVLEINEEINNFIEDMRATMHFFTGLAIAAPQVGQSLQIIVVNAVIFDEEEDSVIINPRLDILSEDKITDIEFCLSFPMGKYISRYTEVQVKYLDRKMQENILHADTAMKARILQHECDHLNGVSLHEK
jgi:peptide deformylase